MTRNATLRALATAAALAALTLTSASVSATAKPDGPGVPVEVRFDPYQTNCPLRRIERQFVRCDNLTGAGVAAPLWVPQA